MESKSTVEVSGKMSNLLSKRKCAEDVDQLDEATSQATTGSSAYKNGGGKRARDEKNNQKYSKATVPGVEQNVAKIEKQPSTTMAVDFCPKSHKFTDK